MWVAKAMTAVALHDPMNVIEGATPELMSGRQAKTPYLQRPSFSSSGLGLSRMFLDKVSSHFLEYLFPCVATTSRLIRALPAGSPTLFTTEVHAGAVIRVHQSR